MPLFWSSVGGVLASTTKTIKQQILIYCKFLNKINLFSWQVNSTTANTKHIIIIFFYNNHIFFY